MPNSEEVSARFPEEPLVESAPLAHRLAQTHCRPLPATGDLRHFELVCRLNTLQNEGFVPSDEL